MVVLFSCATRVLLEKAGKPNYDTEFMPVSDWWYTV